MPVERLSKLNGTTLVLAAFLGTLPGSLLLSVGISRLCPLDDETRFAIGFGLSFIIWCAASSVVWLSRSGLRALAYSAGLALAGVAVSGYLP